MRYLLTFVASLLLASLALAQSPDEDALRRGQQKAGAAFRDLQQAEYETKRVEQDYRQLDADHKTAQKRADDLKQQAEAAKKKSDAAKAKEAAARKVYDAAVNAVDHIAHPKK
jgi:Skp family chaperone for outer membrane proteins